MPSHRNQKRSEFKDGINVQWTQVSSFEKFDMRVAIGLLLAMVLILIVYETQLRSFKTCRCLRIFGLHLSEKGRNRERSINFKS